ncbi:MAG: chloride channel protein [SAR324 cluster bacterium]|nr:chloride channel protein [SAR324 cluster bacterium]
MKRLVFFSQTHLRTFMAHERLFTLLAAFAIGVVGGLGALGFRYLIEGFGAFFGRFAQWSEQWLGFGWPGVLLAPALGGLIVGPVIFRYAREARGHGVPEVMAAVIQNGGFIRPRVVWVKSFASAISISSGGSVGREGPIIQIGSTIGSILGYLLHVPPRLMRTFVACGAAAGIAATFNAPIAGSLFAVEIILGDFGFTQLAPIVTSSVIATVIARGAEGDIASFVVPPYELVNPLELLFYIGLGLLCGVAAVLFIRTLDKMEQFFENRVPLHEAVRPALGGLLVGMIGLFLPQVFSVGYDTITRVLLGELPLLLLAALSVAKLLATTITLASGGSGGVFAPSLFMGAMLGGVVGKLARFVAPSFTASSGAYSLVGMAAMVGAATHAPITAIMIIFELTSDYKIILPLMICTIIAVVTANYLHRESIYTHKLKKKGIELDQGMETNLLNKVQVRDMMRTEFAKAPQDMPFSSLVDLLLETARSRVPIVDGEGRMVGTVTRDVAQKFLSDKNLLSGMVIAKDVATQDAPLVLPEQTLDQVTHVFREYRCREVYVVDNRQDRHVLGILHKGDLMDAYQRELVKRNAGDTFAYGINNPHRMETVNVMDGYGIIELEAPHDFSGKTLRELDLRNRFGVNVLAIKRPSDGEAGPSQKMWVPERNDSIQDGDVLVLLGETESINELQKLW